MADVKDLLIRMSLDTADFKKNIADANKEIKTLKAEFKAAASGDDVENVGKALLDNLQQQKTAAEALVKEYGIRLSPTLIIRGGEEDTVKLAGLGPIRRYINEQKVFGLDNRLTVGLDFRYDDYNAESFSGAARSKSDFDRARGALFVHDELWLTEELSLVAGARLERIENHWSGAASVRRWRGPAIWNWSGSFPGRRSG